MLHRRMALRLAILLADIVMLKYGWCGVVSYAAEFLCSFGRSSGVLKLKKVTVYMYFCFESTFFILIDE